VLLKFLPLLALLGLAGPAHATGKAPAPAPLAARFTLQVDHHRSDWRLWRQAERIETTHAGSGESEIWERDGAQRVAYTRVFPRDHKVVEYTHGELRTRHAEPEWAQLASVVAPQWRAQLKPGETKTLFGQRAIRYRGRIGAERIDLWWLEQAQLPAALTQAGPKGRRSLILQALHATPPEGWPRVTENQLATYARLDASDFGDMESDPFVARLLREAGHGHHQGAHGH
jgi:hypothetical protein